MGKSHLAAGLGRALIENGYRVLFTRTTDLVQRLQTARQELTLAAAIDKLDRFHLLVLDDLSYVRKTQAETSVLFELIAARYERRSLMIMANQLFGGGDSVFADQAMTVAAIDRLGHHATIMQINIESYRRLATLDQMFSKPKEVLFAPGSVVVLTLQTSASMAFSTTLTAPACSRPQGTTKSSPDVVAVAWQAGARSRGGPDGWLPSAGAFAVSRASSIGR